MSDEKAEEEKVSDIPNMQNVSLATEEFPSVDNQTQDNAADNIIVANTVVMGPKDQTEQLQVTGPMADELKISSKQSAESCIAPPANPSVESRQKGRKAESIEDNELQSKGLEEKVHDGNVKSISTEETEAHPELVEELIQHAQPFSALPEDAFVEGQKEGCVDKTSTQDTNDGDVSAMELLRLLSDKVDTRVLAEIS